MQKQKFMNDSLSRLSQAIRNVPDFPKKGIIFKDITTLLKDNELLKIAADLLTEKYKDKGITKVVGIESRGFILGGILAYNLGAGFVLMRKPGKLPADTFKIQYELEYGSDQLEIHKDAIQANDIVLLHDDLLATGGSALAAIELVNLMNPKKLIVNFLIELEFLEGRERLENIEVDSLLKF
jgi:adenine phosphoribosyltransferase